MDSVVLEIDQVFLYQIEDKLKSCLKASEWDTSNPVWYGKLQIIEVPSNHRQVQFVHSNEIFGVAANKDPMGSPMFKKARDSDRYFTTDIVKAISGKNEVFGIGFQNRADGLRLLEGLGQYCTLKDGITTGKNPIIKVEINDDDDGVSEESEVEATNSQAYPSEETTNVQCHNNTTTNNVLQNHFDKSSENHADDREKELDCLDLNSTASSERAQFSYMPQSPLFSSVISSTTAEPPEPAIAIDEYENGITYFVQANNGKNQYVCHLCPKTAKFCLLKLKELLNHWTTQHDLKEPFTCSFCHLIFSTREQLLHHSSSRHNIYVCSMEFEKLANYKRHVCFTHTTHTEEKRQEEIADNTSHNEHNVQERLASGDKPKKFKTATFEQEININATNSDEASCSRIVKKRKIQSTPQEINPVHIINSRTELVRKNENGVTYLRQVDGKSQYICHLCPAGAGKFCSLTIKELLDHWDIEHNLRQRNTCRLCHLVFSTPEERLRHVTALHVVCNTCSMEFRSERNHNRHTRNCNFSEGKRQEIPSGQCVPSVLVSVGLSNNENGTSCVDPVTNELVCPLCGFKTHSKKNMSLLLAHWQSFHDMEAEPNSCRLCFIIFSTPEQRLSHTKTHHLICSICSIQFIGQNKLLQHLKYWHLSRKYGMSGGNGKHYVCNRCPKEFSNINDLVDHFEPTDINKRLHDPKFMKD